MSEFKAEFYENGDEIPVKEFLDSLDNKMRAKVGTDISRVLYFFYYQGRIILTHGFVKKAQKTPSSEIEKAKNYRKDFIERNGE